jgi:hypothetical protein
MYKILYLPEAKEVKDVRYPGHNNVATFDNIEEAEYYLINDLLPCLTFNREKIFREYYQIVVIE